MAAGKTITSVNPATGDIIAEFDIADAAAVEQAVRRAREAQAWWGRLGFAGRRTILRAWAARLSANIDELADLVHQEVGKPHEDAVLEIGLAVDHIGWAARNASKHLGRRGVNPGLLMANQSAQVEYRPLGVIGVIGPWNYPVFTPMGSIAYALAAGNAVVFKPSEYSSAIGMYLADSFKSVAHGRTLLECVTGGGETGEALCRSGVNKVAFTGSGATGKRVMAACADTLTPVLIEAGGKDALIVDDDADLDAAATAALWGGMSNAGQTCIGTERVFVHRRVFDEFMELLVTKARGIEAGRDYGPATMASQLDVIAGHIDAALTAGARIALGGRESVGERYVAPTILTHVPLDCPAMTEETFGPVLFVNPVDSIDEAVALANSTPLGLAGSVFGKRNARKAAWRLRGGMTAVNGVITFAGVPGLPFGGVGESGFGRIHGPDGLREFSSAKAVTSKRLPAPVDVTRFDRRDGAIAQFAKIINMTHGKRGN